MQFSGPNFPTGLLPSAKPTRKRAFGATFNRQSSVSSPQNLKFRQFMEIYVNLKKKKILLDNLLLQNSLLFDLISKILPISLFLHRRLALFPDQTQTLALTLILTPSLNLILILIPTLTLTRNKCVQQPSLALSLYLFKNSNKIYGFSKFSKGLLTFN